MTARAELAAAMSAVDGITVTAHYRQSLKPGDGFVRWAGSVPEASNFGWVNTWEIWLAIPQDPATAEEWVESKLPLLLAAFEAEVIQVTAANPAELLLGTTTTNGLILSGTRQAD